MKITQINLLIFYGDALSNVIFANDRFFRDKGYASNIVVDAFSERRGVSELVIKDYTTSSFVGKIQYVLPKLLRINDKIKYMKLYYKALKHYQKNIGKNKIENADIRIWGYGGWYSLFSYFHERDILFFVGITYPYLSADADVYNSNKIKLLSILDMQPFCITESKFIKQSLIDLGFNDKNIYILPLFHKFSLPYVVHQVQIGKLLTWGRYATNKGIPELAEFCNKNNIPLTTFGDNDQNVEFKDNYNMAKKFENEDITILPKQKEFEPFLENNNIFISNSYHEGFLMPAVESMAHSLPLLIRRGTAPDDFFVDKKHLPGLQFDNLTEIPSLIEKIMNNYAFYSNNSYKLSKKYTLAVYKKNLFRILRKYQKYKKM